MVDSARSKAELLALWRLVLPPSYTVPIETEANGQGFDVPSAQAALFAEVSAAIVQTWQAQYVRQYPTQIADPASGPVQATVALQIGRNAASNYDLWFPAGARLYAQQDSSRGEALELPVFEVVADTLLASGSDGPITVNARAVYPGTAGNVRAGSIVRFRREGRAAVLCQLVAVDRFVRVAPTLGSPNPDHFDPLAVGRYVTLTSTAGITTVPLPPRRITAVQNNGEEITFTPALAAADVNGTATVSVVEWEDLGVVVSQPSAATGGKYGTLDAIARDHGMQRVDGESDAELSERVARLVEVVTPGAINAILARILSPCGIRFRLLETGDPLTFKGVIWDIDAWDFGSLSPNLNNGSGSYFGNGSVYVDEGSAWTYFVVAMSQGNAGEIGAAWTASPVSAPNPANAFDASFAWDGWPVEYGTCLAQAADAINQARAGGVGWSYYRDSTL